jgi:hypothetical protein
MAEEDVPSPVDFHDPAQAQEWIEHTIQRRPWRRRFVIGIAARALCVCALAWPVHGFAQTADASAQGIPDFAGNWIRFPWRLFEPPPVGPGPVIDPRGHDLPNNVLDVGDPSNPILKPHAAAAIQRRNNLIAAGGFPLRAWARCRPIGVPGVLNLGEPVQFLQASEQITVLYQRDSQVRRVDLNGKHPNNAQPSWYGHSIGHYEGANVLVIDTIALDDRADTDRLGTPHSEKMHVVERYTLDPDGSFLTVDFAVEDPETFTTAWAARVRYRREQELHRLTEEGDELAAAQPGMRPASQIGKALSEKICAENNRNAASGTVDELNEIPVATRREF